MKFVRNIRGIIPKKNESIDDLSLKVLKTLILLNDIDKDLFSIWYEQGWSKKEALSKKVIFDQNFISQIINKEWDKKKPELGSKFSFWSGKDDDLTNSSISFRIGLISKNENLNNRVVITFPMIESMSFPKNSDEVKEITKFLKEIWDTKIVEIDEEAN